EPHRARRAAAKGEPRRAFQQTDAGATRRTARRAVRRRIPGVIRCAPVAVMAGAAERELDHMGLARDDAELAPQSRHQRSVPLPRICRQPTARPGEAGGPGRGEQVLDRTRQSLEGPTVTPAEKAASAPAATARACSGAQSE